MRLYSAQRIRCECCAVPRGNTDIYSSRLLVFSFLLKQCSGFQYIPRPFFPVSDHWIPISYSQYLQSLFDLISTSFSWSSSFSYSFHSTRLFFFFLHLPLYIIQLRPYHPNLTALIHSVICVPYNVSCIYLFVLTVVKYYYFLLDCTFLLQSACRIGLL